MDDWIAVLFRSEFDARIVHNICTDVRVWSANITIVIRSLSFAFSLSICTAKNGRYTNNACLFRFANDSHFTLYHFRCDPTNDVNVHIVNINTINGFVLMIQKKKTRTHTSFMQVRRYFKFSIDPLNRLWVKAFKHSTY